MKNEHTHNSRWFFIPGVLFAAVVLSAGLSAGFWLSGVIFRFTGRPPEFLAYIISGLIGFTIMMLCSRIFFWTMNKTGHRNNNEHWIAAETLEALDKISRGDFSVVLDVNEHDHFTKLKESINEMAKNLGTLETMRQDFISNVSHEIQSPLTSISGFAALLKDDSLPAGQRVHYAAIIEAESKRLSGLSENLLKLSALESQDAALSVGNFRLDKQIESVALTLEPQWAAKNISPEAELAKTFYTGDEALLSQVWINLLHNAIKFTPEDGQIHIALARDGDFICIKISDTGSGISPDDQIHIFERFYKADKARDRSLGGNGLGLSLVKKIVELHGGHVTVESELGKGSAFCVFLPLKR